MRSGDARVHLNIAQALAGLGRYEEAVSELSLVPRGSTERAAAMRDQAVILLNVLKRPEAGLAALKEAASLSTDPNEKKLLDDEVLRLQTKLGR